MFKSPVICAKHGSVLADSSVNNALLLTAGDGTSTSRYFLVCQHRWSISYTRAAVWLSKSCNQRVLWAVTAATAKEKW